MNIYSASNSRKKQCVITFLILLPLFVYSAVSLSALFKLDFNIKNLQQTIIYTLTHFYLPEKANEKTGICVIIGLLVWTIVFATSYTNAAMNLMHGQEHGTASWGSIKEFNKKYASDIESENKILSENVRMTYDIETLRNNNMFIVGGSGAGKTAFAVSPNMLNLHGSNLITDPKGSVLEDYGEYLRHQPNTRVYQINLCEMEKSMRFNPFPFIRKQSDVPKLINNIMANTEPQETNAAAATDPFWPKAESMYLQSIFYYIWTECPKISINPDGEEEILKRNFSSVLKLLDEAKIDDEGMSPLDIRMELLNAASPNHIAYRTYQRFKAGAGDTMRSIIICANSRFNVFDNEEVLNILSDNDIPLDEIGTGKNADGKTKSYLFLIIPDDDDTYNFIPGMIFTLFFQEAYRQARFYKGNKLPLDVGVWLDEFANVKMPSNFEKILSTCRSRGIYCVPILQSLAQIKKLFKDGAWEGVVGNCDTFIYLGGNEQSSHKYISELLGKWTIDKRTSGESIGIHGSTSRNFDVLGRDLLDSPEMRLLPENKCIILVRGEKPLIDNKWFLWTKKIYKKAKSYGTYKYAQNNENVKEIESEAFISQQQFEYYTQLEAKENNIQIYDDLDIITFLQMDIASMYEDDDITEEDLSELINNLSETDLERIEREAAEQKREFEIEEFMADYDVKPLLEIYTSPLLETERKECIIELQKLGISEDTIKREISLYIPLSEVIKTVAAAKDYYSNFS